MGGGRPYCVIVRRNIPASRGAHGTPGHPEGDLAQPYAHSLFERARGALRTFVEIVRESRDLEKKMLGENGFRRFGES